MRVKRLCHVCGLFVGLLLAFNLSSGFSQEIEISPQYYHIKNFKFVSGDVLPEMVVEYGTIGTKKTDAAGNIVNAIVWCHGWSGNYAQIKDAKAVVGPGKVIDTDKYFIIAPTAIGSPGSSSPSTSKLGPKFPKYTPRDMANAQYRLITEHFKVKHLKGVIGASMGGFQTLEWAANYPDFMDFIIAIATSYESAGRSLGNAFVVNNAIRKDPRYKDGYYTEQPVDGLAQGAMGQFLWYLSAPFYRQTFPTNQVFLNVLQGEGKKGANADANDVVWRNDNLMAYSVKDRIGTIKAKALIIGINQDEIFPPDTDTVPLAKAIKGVTLFTFDSPLGHVGAGRDLKKAESAIGDFLKAD
jgi:homoserine O-acetyltransferase